MRSPSNIILESDIRGILIVVCIGVVVVVVGAPAVMVEAIDQHVVLVVGPCIRSVRNHYICYFSLIPCIGTLNIFLLRRPKGIIS